MEKICVLMPCYNAEKYIKEAIDSILKQTYAEFSLLIINDGSTDSSAGIVRELAETDSRIRFMENDRNRGATYTRNRGIEEADAEYIALMDADDIAPIYRLQEEMDYLTKHPETDAIGGLYQIMNEDGTLTKTILDTVFSDGEIRAFMIFGNPISNGCMLFRRQILIDHNIRYREGIIAVEDYMFWAEYMQYGHFYNLDRVLQYYRMNQGSLSRLVNPGRNAMIQNIHKIVLKNLNISLNKSEQSILFNVTSEKSKWVTPAEYIRLKSVLKKITLQTVNESDEFHKEFEQLCRIYMAGKLSRAVYGVKKRWLS